MTTRARGAQAGTIRCQYGIETQPAYRGGVFALIVPEFMPVSLPFGHSGSRSTFVASAAVLLGVSIGLK
ncbi:MAG: hypothetical protein KGQ32_06265 [Xanthomonadaceae bacterium]|nr:hypothetical protein [Xanthomonadaceae bacterium]